MDERTTSGWRNDTHHLAQNLMSEEFKTVKSSLERVTISTSDFNVLSSAPTELGATRFPQDRRSSTGLVKTPRQVEKRRRKSVQVTNFGNFRTKTLESNTFNPSLKKLEYLYRPLNSIDKLADKNMLGCQRRRKPECDKDFRRQDVSEESLLNPQADFLKSLDDKKDRRLSGDFRQESHENLVNLENTTHLKLRRLPGECQSITGKEIQHGQYKVTDSSSLQAQPMDLMEHACLPSNETTVLTAQEEPTTSPRSMEQTVSSKTVVPTTLAISPEPTTLPRSVDQTTLSTSAGPTTSQTSAEPTTLPTSMEPIASLKALEPTTSQTSAEPTTSQTSAELTTSPTSAEQITSPTSAEPTTLPTLAEPTTSPTSAELTTSPTSAEPTTSPTSAEPTTSPAVMKPSFLSSPSSEPTVLLVSGKSTLKENCLINVPGIILSQPSSCATVNKGLASAEPVTTLSAQQQNCRTIKTCSPQQEDDVRQGQITNTASEPTDTALERHALSDPFTYDFRNIKSCSNINVSKKEANLLEKGSAKLNDTIYLAHFPKMGRRHSIHVEGMLIDNEIGRARAVPKHKLINIDDNRPLVTSRRNSLAGLSVDLKSKNSFGNSTQQRNILGPIGWKPTRRNSACNVKGDLHILNSVENVRSILPTKFTHAQGGRHSEERNRERLDYPERISKFLLKCESELPTSTLLEIKRLREENLEKDINL